MAVRDGVVVWLGADNTGRAHFPHARVVDLDDGFVTPAFVDSHIHVTATGLTLTGLDLRPATSRRHCLRMVADYAAAHRGQPVWGHGWDESRWPEHEPPSTAELDAVLGDRPGYLARIDMHSALASSALRRLVPGLAGAAGFSAQRPLVGEAHRLVRAAARGRLTGGQLAEARTAALDAAAACGIVAVHECAGPGIGGLDDWQRVRDSGHRVEVIGYWGEAVTSPGRARHLLRETGARGLAGDLFVDGALGSRTAWLHEPYADSPESSGVCYLDPEAITAHLRACTEAGVTAGFHVIGDAAVSAVVTALEQVVDAFGVAAVARCGHRLEHVEMVTADQAAKLAAWGVIASVQPNFDALWGGRHGMYADRLGAERASRLNNVALLASQGVPLAFGSDAPVTDLNPWTSVRAAANHRTPGSAVSAQAAFAAATRGGWRAAGVRDALAGTLTPGAPASYAIWDIGELDSGAPTWLAEVSAHRGAEHSGVSRPGRSGGADARRRGPAALRSRVPALPRLGPADALPRCRQTVRGGLVIYG